MKVLFTAAVVMSAAATASSAEVVRYKANFPEKNTEWISYVPGQPDAAPSVYQGWISISWSFDASIPDTGSRISNIVYRGLGYAQKIDPITSNYTACDDNTCVGGYHDAGSGFWEAGFIAYGDFSYPPTDEKLRSMDVYMSGDLLTDLFPPEYYPDYGVSSKAAWVTVAPVPLPSSLPLLLAGLGSVGWISVRKKPKIW